MVDRDAHDAGVSARVRNSGMHFSLNTGSFRSSVAEIAPVASLAGFRGLELWARDVGDIALRDQVGDLLTKNDLRVSAFQLLRDYEGASSKILSERLEEAERLMADMAAIGAKTLLLCANTAPDSSSDGARIAADLTVLADMAAHRDMRIALEPLAWSRWLNNYVTANACVTAVDHPALGLTIDAFHWFWAGTAVEFAQQIPIGKCFEIQLCDAKPDGRPAIEVARHHRLFPGEGIWPVSALAREFSARGFAGFYNIEVFNDAYKELAVEEFASRAARSVNLVLDDLA